MSEQSRKVVFAELHSEVFLPGVGQLPRQFDTSPKSQNSKLRGLSMYAGSQGLEVDIKGRKGVLPYGNVKWCLFESEAEAEAEKTKTVRTPFAVTSADRDHMASQAASTPTPATPKTEESKNPVALDEKTLAAVKRSLT